MVCVQMARPSRSAIEQFAALTGKPFPEGIVDLNDNDTYLPKEDIMSEWTAIPEKNEDGSFCLCFTYELNTTPDQPEQWVQVKTWEIESVEGQSEYVVLDLKNKNDHVNLLLHYKIHTFSYVYACNNSSPDAKPFNLNLHFSSYTLSAYWTSRKLTALAVNISKYNSLIAEGNKKKKSPRKQTTSGAGGSRSAPRQVPTQSRQSGGASQRQSRQSTPSKRSREDMEKSSVTEGAEVSSEPLMPTPLKKGESPDAVKATRILSDFNQFSKDCWPLGRHFTFKVDCFKCEKSPDKWVVRTRQDAGVNWQINNLMNNVKWDKQTVCVMPKTDTPPTKANWAEVSKGEFWIIDGQHTLEAARIILQNPLYEHELKGDLQYWKAFVVWSQDWNRLRKISKFLNSGNKIKAFEASWAANIVAASDVWIAHGSPPKERENAKVQSPSWKVRTRASFLCTQFLRTVVRIHVVS